MLQRVQSIYLLVTFILTLLLLILPMGYILQDGMLEVFKVNAVGAYALVSDPSQSSVSSQMVETAWTLFILVCIILGLTIYDIFMFRKRMLQIRIAVFNMLLQLGIYALFAFYYFFLMPNQGIISGVFQPSWTILIPILNVILTYLAIRKIGADEALIRSLDRLR